MTATDERAVAPSNITYGKVIGRFLSIIGDTPADPDTDPDALPAQGTVTFTSEAAYLLDRDGAPPATLIPAAVKCTVDANGDLLDPAGAIGVWLLATDAPVNPSGFTYRVTQSFVGSPDRVFSIAVPGGATVDLTTVTPLADNTGQVAVQGPPGDTGPPGPQGDPGLIVLSATAPVPGGTPAGTVILRTVD